MYFQHLHLYNKRDFKEDVSWCLSFVRTLSLLYVPPKLRCRCCLYHLGCRLSGNRRHPDAPSILHRSTRRKKDKFVKLLNKLTVSCPDRIHPLLPVFRFPDSPLPSESCLTLQVQKVNRGSSEPANSQYMYRGPAVASYSRVRGVCLELLQSWFSMVTISSNQVQGFLNMYQVFGQTGKNSTVIYFYPIWSFPWSRQV